MLNKISECTSLAIKCYVRQGPWLPQSVFLCSINRHVRNVYVPGTCTNWVIYLTFTRMFVGFQYVVGLKKLSNVKTRPSVFAWNSVVPWHRCLRCNFSSDEHWNGGIFILTLSSPLLITCLPVYAVFQTLFICPFELVHKRLINRPGYIGQWPQIIFNPEYWASLFWSYHHQLVNVANTIL